MATATRKKTAMICTVCLRLGANGFVCDFGRIERRRQAFFLAVVACPVPEARPADAGRTMPADDLAVRILSDQIVDEEILRDDDIAFHAQTSVMWVILREPSRRRAAWTMTSTEATIISRMVRDGSAKPPMVIIDSRRDSASRGVLACSVPIEPSWPVFIACSRSNASGPRTSPTMMRSGPHTQAVLDQIAHRDLALAFEVGRPRFQAHDVRLLQLKFGGVFAGDDALVVIDDSAVRQLSSVVLPEPVRRKSATLHAARGR